MIQAAAAGVIDFTRSDPRDRMWISKVRMLCDQIEMVSFGRYNELLRTLALASLARSDLTDESYDKLREHASEYTVKVRSALFPWVKPETEEAKKSAYQSLYDLWVDIWGDPADPETAAAIEATAARMTAPPGARTR